MFPSQLGWTPFSQKIFTSCTRLFHAGTVFFVYGEMCLCLFLVWLHKDAQWFNFYVYYCFTNDNEEQEEEERDEWINEITQLGDFFFYFYVLWIIPIDHE